MNPQSPLFFYLLFAGIAFFVGREIYKFFRRMVAVRRAIEVAREEALAAMVVELGKTRESMDRLCAHFSSNAEHGETAEKLLSGIMRCCAALVESTEKHRLAVAAFSEVIAEKPKYPDDALIPPSTEDEANLFSRKLELMLEGYKEDTAIELAAQEAEKKTVTSAASMTSLG